MQFLSFLTAAVALVGSAAAKAPTAEGLLASISQYPQCGTTCLTASLANTTCDLADAPCICGDTKFQDVIQVCVLKSCTVKEALTIKNLTATGCEAPIRDKGNVHLTVSNTLGIITGVFVIQRIAYKLWAKLDFWYDDWFTLATIVTGTPVTVINAYKLGPNGMGKDVWTIPFSHITEFIKYFYIIEIFYFLEVATMKIALLFFFLRIFPANNVRRLLWGTIAVVSLYGISFVFAGIFQCGPVSFFWDKWDGAHKGQCIDINALAWSNAAISIALDLWMLCIPMVQLKKLKLDWRRKISVGFMFFVGTFVTVVSILRLRSLITFGADTLNPTWEFFEVALWSDIEINVGIICACLPTFRLLLMRLFPILKGTTIRSYAKYSGSANKSGNHHRSRNQSMGGSAIASSHAASGESRVNLESGKIAYSKSYAVEYGEMDEMDLLPTKASSVASDHPGRAS